MKDHKLSCLLIVCMMLLTATGAFALSQTEYEEQVSTYSIDASVPGFRDYAAAHSGEPRPSAEIVIDAVSALTRYEQDGQTVEPVLIRDLDGVPGDALLTA